MYLIFGDSYCDYDENPDYTWDFEDGVNTYQDPKDVATLKIFDDGNQVGTTVHLDVSDIQGLDQVFLAGSILDEAGHDSSHL